MLFHVCKLLYDFSLLMLLNVFIPARHGLPIKMIQNIFISIFKVKLYFFSSNLVMSNFFVKKIKFRRKTCKIYPTFRPACHSRPVGPWALYGPFKTGCAMLGLGLGPATAAC
jgi:hypothetical protein